MTSIWLDIRVGVEQCFLISLLVYQVNSVLLGIGVTFHSSKCIKIIGIDSKTKSVALLI